jgi:S-(hydroxymethyl)glutathione dehydrogenase/alcohol dehydrogenase
MAHDVPVVLGHEGAGIVEDVGPNVQGISVGDHVITSYQPSCGRCWYCTIGRPNLCALRDKPRHVMWDGTTRFRDASGEDVFHFLQVSSHSEYAVLPTECVIPIRKDAPLEVVCLVSCGVATGFGAVVNRAKVTPGSTVVVVGCGGVGLNAVQAARFAGAAVVVAVDILPAKREAALSFGATHGVDSSDPEKCLAEVREICGRGGADYVIEAVGRQTTIELAWECIHRGGTVVVIGIGPDGSRISIDPRTLLQERVLTGTSFGSSRQRVDLPMLVDLFMAGSYKLRELISIEVGLEDLNEAYASLERGELNRGVLVY